MKKKRLGLIIMIVAVFAVGTSAYAATYVNNEDVSKEVFTTISNDYTLFPVRYLGEKLGCDVYWNPDDKCITVSKGDIHRDFYNGSPVVYDWNGNSYSLVTAPMLVDGNTMVPAEFYRDHFGISVLWDSVTSSLFINSEDTYNWLINTPEYKNSINPYYEYVLNSGGLDSYDDEVSDVAIIMPCSLTGPSNYQRTIVNVTDVVSTGDDRTDGSVIIIPKYANSTIKILKIHREMQSPWTIFEDEVLFKKNVGVNEAVELLCFMPEICPENKVVITSPNGNVYEYIPMNGGK